LILDTCFFIDEQRKQPEPALFLRSNQNARLYTTVINAGELASGINPSKLDRLWTRLIHFELLEITPAVVVQYGAAFQRLRGNGLMIGTNDLWIAAIALANDLPIVTRNTQEFSRVPNLKVVSY